jgi:hypothetical protein
MSLNSSNFNNVRSFFTAQVNSSSSPSDGSYNSGSGESSDEYLTIKQQQQRFSFTGAEENALFSQSMSEIDVDSRALVAASSGVLHSVSHQQLASLSRPPRQNDLPRPHASYVPLYSLSANLDSGSSCSFDIHHHQYQTNSLLASSESLYKKMSFRKRILNSFQNQQQYGLNQHNTDHSVKEYSHASVNSLAVRPQCFGFGDASNKNRFSGKVILFISLFHVMCNANELSLQIRRIIIIMADFNRFTSSLCG